jgi:transcriptional regulator with XRE-family HTH domain
MGGRKDNMKDVLARNLRAAMLVQGWTQESLAVNAGLSRATVNEILGGGGDPRLSTVDAVAKAVGLTLGELVSSEGGETCFEEERRMLLSGIARQEKAAIRAIGLRLGGDVRRVIRAVNKARKA